MRSVLLLSLLVPTPALAQPTLTKDETINYINKKLAEASGSHSTYSEGPSPLWYRSVSVSLRGARMTVSYVRANREESGEHCPYVRGCRSDYRRQESEWNFNPALIRSIAIEESGPVGCVLLNLSTADARHTSEWFGWIRDQNAQWETYHWQQFHRETDNYDVVHVPYLATDPQNFDRLKKAFLHLQALLKAEDDPFGNE